VRGEEEEEYSRRSREERERERKSKRGKEREEKKVVNSQFILLELSCVDGN
jgi:hypothetical protein